MTELDQLAAEIGVSGRTLRRAAARRTIRSTRQGRDSARARNALRRPVRLVPLDQAPPLLLADVFRDGRVLADRDGDWERLWRCGDVIERAAQDDDARLERSAWRTLEQFEELVTQ